MVAGEEHEPLAGILAELDARSPWCRYATGDPEGDGWVGVEAVLTDPAILADWIGRLLAGAAQGRADVAGAYLSGWLAGLLVGPVASMAIVGRRAWNLAPGALAVRRHPDGWFDGLTVRRATVVVLADDELAASLGPGVRVVPDQRLLLDDLAGEIVALLTPLFGQIRQHVSFGSAGMWGAAADAVADAALDHAGHSRSDPIAAWSGATTLIDGLAARVPTLRARPTLARVDWSGGVAHLAVRGTCCLYHKVAGCDLAPTGEAYCVSCPKRDPDDRLRRWSAGLEQLQAAL